MSDGVIVSVAQTAMSRRSGRTSLQLQAEAAHLALEKAGISFMDVDGLLTLPLGTDSWMMPVAVVADYFGLTPKYFATVDLAGASGCAMAAQAVQAIQAGLCKIVLCVGGAALHAHGEEADIVRHMAETGTAHPQFELPHGPSLVSLYALIAARYLHEFDATRADLADIAVATRAYATNNPSAIKRTPISRNEVLDSKPISDPITMLDCSLVCDGAVAFVIMEEELARETRRQPVHMLGYGQALGPAYVSAVKDLVRTPAVHSGKRAFEAANLSPDDVNVAQLYDCFTIATLLEIEDLGFCAKGSAAVFVRDGGTSLNGNLPVNTHGGLLSGGHPGLAGGMTHVAEAVRQLQGASSNQVENASVALAHGNGGVAGIHSTLILGLEPRS